MSIHAEPPGTPGRADAGVAADPAAPRGRVLFLCPQPFFEWRGSPIRVGFDVRALTELGYAVDLLVMPVGADRDIPGVRLHRAPNLLRVRSLPIGPSAAKAVLDIGLFFRAWGLIRRHRYVAIHGVEETGALAVILARMARCRCIFEKHSDPGSYRRGRLRNLVMAAYARVEAFTIRRADAIIGTGPGLVEQARRLSPRGSVHHIFDIPSSLEEADPARVAAARAQRLAPGEGPLVMYVGSFAVYQGVDLMFESLPRVVRAAPQTRIAIVGGSPEDIARAQARLAQAGAGGRCGSSG
jgi:glycosyltransferase involved in cell wall biosynthesis